MMGGMMEGGGGGALGGSAHGWGRDHAKNLRSDVR